MTNNPVIHLPGLNGIRAIAALAVVVSHITQSLADFGLDPFIFGVVDKVNPRGIDLGGFGVSIFFTLSGFLITYLLLVEREKNRWVSIKKFYLRRLLRIWPLYYLYFAVVFLIYVLLNYKFSSGLIPYYVFFGANLPFIMGTTLPFLSHYWSIGVEEQFYLFWPWFFKLKHNILIVISIVLIFILIGVKSYLHVFSPDSILETVIHVSRFHCMLIGAIGAILFFSKNELFIKFSCHLIAQITCWGVLVAAAINRFHIASFLDNEFISVISVPLIMGQITRKSFVKLENRLFDFLGKISYGIYIIHPIIIFLLAKIMVGMPLVSSVKLVLVFGVIIGITIIMSFVSYEFFEKRFLKLKIRRFSVVHSSGSINED